MIQRCPKPKELGAQNPTKWPLGHLVIGWCLLASHVSAIPNDFQNGSSWPHGSMGSPNPWVLFGPVFLHREMILVVALTRSNCWNFHACWYRSYYMLFLPAFFTAVCHVAWLISCNICNHLLCQPTFYCMFIKLCMYVYIYTHLYINNQ